LDHITVPKEVVLFYLRHRFSAQSRFFYWCSWLRHWS